MADKITVTLDVFSGRKNSVIEYTGKDLKELKKRLKPIGKTDRKSIQAPPILGYRGLIIEQNGQVISDLPRKFRLEQGHSLVSNIAYPVTDDCIEDFICGSVPKKFPIDELQRHRDLVDFREIWELPKWAGGLPIYTN